MAGIAQLLRRFGGDVLDMLSPPLCPSCNTLLNEQERGYCMACRASLEHAPPPPTLYTKLIEKFGPDGVALHAICSLYLFNDGNPVQALIHALKYKGCYGLGIELGAELGKAIRMFPEFSGVDVIVPVPVHRARRRERGYNQSEAIAAGLASALSIEVMPGALKRVRHTPSQTTLGAEERKKNITSAFGIKMSDQISGKRVLLCDDVLTTGATLNFCAEQLLVAGAEWVAATTVAYYIPG